MSKWEQSYISKNSSQPSAQENIDIVSIISMTLGLKVF